MTERHHIWQQRQNHKRKPWTEDSILQRYRFCNVFRELDTVTIWIRENIRVPFAKHRHLWFMLAIARTINWPPTLKELMEGDGGWPDNHRFSPERMTKILDARKARGEQVYTGAYMIRAESNKKADWYHWTKQRYISEIVLGRLWEHRDDIAFVLKQESRLEDVWHHICKGRFYIGWGPFMTYEWVTDLRWTRYLRTAKDIKTWANAGPGALRGLRRLRGNDGQLSPNGISAPEALHEMQDLLEAAPKNLPPGFNGLELRDIEHSLCETDKYLRVYYGEGRPRSLYDGLA
jgi:hypothetical protein